jgi:2-methylcitrate dehydratase PrpD
MECSVNLSQQLASWCANYHLHFPDSAIAHAEIGISDAFGCMLRGRNDPAVVAAGKSIPDLPSGKSRSVRHNATIAAPWAALVNGCAAHALDFDDNFFPAITHASAVLVPALIALAEDIEASPDAIVRAYIVGLEVEAQIGKLVNPSHYESGWHATSTIGVIGAAAACAVLMRLDSTQMLNAISIGCSLAGGSKRQFGTMTKPMHAGFAAMHAIIAAQLAAAGTTGMGEMLVGKWSFSELCSDNNISSVEPRLYPQSPLAIEGSGLVAKLYPSCMSSHLGIDAMLMLRAAHDFDLADITSIDIHMPEFMVANVRYLRPENEMEARFSMNYCAAVALLYGVPRLQHFTMEALQDPLLKPLLPLVHMHVRAADADSAALPWGGDCVGRISLRDGRQLEQHVTYPKGCREYPLTTTEHHGKFIDCTAGYAKDIDPEKLYAAVSKLSRITTLQDITAAL